MNTSLVFGILSGLLSALCYPPYIVAILKGKAKPERASWLIWTVLTAMGFFSQLAIGATHSLWLPGVQGVGVIIVLLLSIKYGYGGLMRRDVTTLLAAGVTLLLWYFTKSPTIAVYLVVLIDGMGAWLTVAKAYEHPETETMITWALSGTAGVCALIAVQSLDPELLSYPLYIMTANYAVVAAMILGRRKRRVV